MDISPISAGMERDRRTSYSRRDRDRSRSRSMSPSRMYERDRRIPSRQGKRDRGSRDDRSDTATPVRNRRSHSRDNRDPRKYRGRNDRRKSRERKSKRDRRSRSRHRSPKRSKKSRRRSSDSSSPDPPSSLIGEIKKQHGNAIVSKNKKKRSKKRRSSSSSSSSVEMQVDGPSSNGTILNIPTPMPPPASMLYQPSIQPMFPQMIFPPPPVPPPAATMEQQYHQQSRTMVAYPHPPPFSAFPLPPPVPSHENMCLPPPPVMFSASSSRDELNVPLPPPANASATTSRQVPRQIENLPLPPIENRRMTSRPVILNRRGSRRRVDLSRDEWGTTQLSDYQMLEQIGEGTYGQVYKAVVKKTGEQVALKRVRLENEKEGFPLTAVREIKILRQLNHKNIVRLIDIVTDTVTVQELRSTRVNFYLVFEYVDHDLMGLLDSKDLIAFSEEQICLLFKQLLEGLAYCHKAGFLHRDIKCSNILVNNKGELKVADLGLARLWHEGADRLYTNRVITLWYRPPELLLGEECYGPEIDVWSAGCMLGELFTRKPLFNGSNEMLQLELISKLCGSPNPDLWPDVVKLKNWDTFKSKKFHTRRIKDDFAGIMPPLAIDLFDRLLSLDPKKRMTAKEALLHPWIRSINPDMVPPLKLPKDQDCHEMWSKKQRRNNRTSLAPGRNQGSPGHRSGSCPRATRPAHSGNGNGNVQLMGNRTNSNSSGISNAESRPSYY